MLLMLASRA